MGEALAKAMLAPFQGPAQMVLSLWKGTFQGIVQLLQPFARVTERIGKLLQSNLAEASPGPTFWIRQHWGRTVDFILDKLQLLKKGAALVRQHLVGPIAKEFNLIRTAFASEAKAGPRAPLEAVFDPAVARQALARQVAGVIPAALALPVQLDSVLSERVFNPIFEQLDLVGFSLLTLASMPMNLVQLLEGMAQQAKLAGTAAPALLGAIEGVPQALMLGLPTIVGGAIYTGFLQGAETGISKATRKGLEFVFGAFGREVPATINRYLDGLHQSFQQVSGFIRSIFEIDLVRWTGNIALMLSMHEALNIPAALGKSATVRAFFGVLGKAVGATLVTFRALAATAGYFISLPFLGIWSLMAEIGARAQASILQSARSIPLVQKAFAVLDRDLLVGSFDALVQRLIDAIPLAGLLGRTLGRFFPLAVELIPLGPIKAVLPAVGEVLAGVARLTVSSLGRSARSIGQFLSVLNPGRFRELYKATDGFLTLGVKAITPLDIISQIFEPERKIIKKKVAAWFGIAARELEGAGKFREIAALSPLARIQLFGPPILQILGRMSLSFLTLYTVLKPLDKEMLSQIAHLHWFTGRVAFLNQSFVMLAEVLRIARFAIVGSTDFLMELAQVALPLVAVGTVKVAQGVASLITLGESIRNTFSGVADRLEGLGRVGTILQAIRVPEGLIGLGNVLGGLVEGVQATGLLGVGLLFLFKLVQTKNPFIAFTGTIRTLAQTLLLLPKALGQVASGIDLVGKATSKQGRQSLQFQTFTQGLRLKTGFVPGFDRQFQQQQFARRKQVLAFQKQIEREAQRHLRRSGAATGAGRSFSQSQLQQARQQVFGNDALLRRAAHRSGVGEFAQLAHAGSVGALRLLGQERSQQEFINAGTLQSKQLKAHIERAEIQIGSASPVQFQGAASVVQQAASQGHLERLSHAVNANLVQSSKELGSLSNLRGLASNLGLNPQEIQAAGNSLENLTQLINQQQVKVRSAIADYEQLQGQASAAAQPGERNPFAAAFAGLKARFGKQPQESNVLDPGLLAARRQELQRATVARFGSPREAQATLDIINRFQNSPADKQANFNRQQIELVAKTFGVKVKPEATNADLARGIKSFNYQSKRRTREQLQLMAGGGHKATMAAAGFMPNGTQGGMHEKKYRRMSEILGEGRFEELESSQLLGLSRKLKVPVAQLLDPTQAVPFAQLRQANPLREQFLAQRLPQAGFADEAALMAQMRKQLPNVFNVKLPEKRQAFIDQQLRFLHQGQTHRMKPELLEKMAEALSLTGTKAKGAVVELEKQIAAQVLLAEESKRSATFTGRLRQAFANLSPRRLVGGAEISYQVGRQRQIQSLGGQIRAQAAQQQRLVGQRQLGLQAQLQQRRGLDFGQLQASLNVSDKTFSEILEHLYQGRVEAIGEQSRIVLAKTLDIAQTSLGDLHTFIPTQAELKVIRVERFKQRVKTLFDPIRSFTQAQYQQFQGQLNRFNAPPVVKRFAAAPGQLFQGFASLQKQHQQQQSRRRYSLQQLMQRQGFDSFEPLVASLQRQGLELPQIQQFLRGPGAGQNLSAALGKDSVEKIAKALGLVERHKSAKDFDRVELKELENLNRHFTTEVVSPFPVFLGKKLAGAVTNKSREIFAQLGRQTVAAGRWGVRAALAVAGPTITRFMSTQARELGHVAGDLVNSMRSLFPRNQFLARIEGMVRGIGSTVSSVLERQTEAALSLRQQMFGRIIQFKRLVGQGLNALFNLFQSSARYLWQGIQRLAPAALSRIQRVFGAAAGAIGKTVGFFAQLIGGIGRRWRLQRRLQVQVDLAQQQRALAEARMLRGQFVAAGRANRRATQVEQEQEHLRQLIAQLGPPWYSRLAKAVGGQLRRAQAGVASALEGISGQFGQLGKHIVPRMPRFTFMERPLRVRNEAGGFVPGERRPGLRRVVPLPETMMAGMERAAQRSAFSISGFFSRSAQQVRSAWREAGENIWGRSWRALTRHAAVAGRSIIGFLNHGAADVTAQAWQRTEGTAAGNMHQLAQAAQTTGRQIEGAMGGAARRSGGMLARLGSSIGGLGKAGFAIGGAVGAAGFAAQSVVGSLSTLGIIDERSSAALSNFMELFSVVGAVGGVVMPLLGAVGTSLGAVAGLVVTVGGAIGTFLISPIGLATAAVVGGVLLLNAGLKEFFGIDLLTPVVSQFSNAAWAIGDLIRQPLSEAADWVQGKWQALADRFSPILNPIVQPALAVAQQLINALNHNPTEVIPLAWEGAVKRIASWLSGLPVVGQLVVGQLTDIFSPSKIFGGLMDGLKKMVSGIKESGLGRLLGGNVLKSLQQFMAGLAQPDVQEQLTPPVMLDVTAALERSQKLAKWGGATPETLQQLQALNAQSFVSPAGQNQMSAAQLAMAEIAPGAGRYVRAGMTVENPDSALTAFAVGTEAVIAGRTDQVKRAMGAVSDEWMDRWSHLERTGTTNVEALFRPGVEAMRNNFAILTGDTVDFARRAGTALVTLNFGELKQSVLDYAGNFAHAARGIIGGYTSMQMSALAFGAYSLLSMGPVVLGLGAVAFGVYAVATNFLGLRNILFGLGKVLVGTVQALFSILKAAYQVGRGVATILGGIRAAFVGDFSQIRAGAAMVWSAIRTGAVEVKAALARIFGGLRQTFQGIFEGLRQLVELFVGSLRSRIEGVAAAFRLIRGAVNLVGNALITAVTRPQQIWQGFLDLLNRIRGTLKGVVQAIGESTVGRAKQKVQGLFGGLFGRKQQSVTPTAAPPSVAVQPKPGSFREQVAQVKQETGRMRQVAGQASSVLGDLGAALGVFAPSLAAPIFAVTSLVEGFMSLSSALPKIGGMLVSLFPALAGAGGLLSSAAAALGLVKGAAIAAWAAISGPLLPIVVGIGAVVGGVLLLRQAFKHNFLGIADLVRGVMDGFRLFWSLLVGGARDIVGGVFGTLFKEIGAIGRAVGQLGSALIEPFKPLLALFGIRGGGGGLFATAIRRSVAAILLPLRLVAASVSSTIRLVSAVIQGAIQVGTVLTRVVLTPLRAVIEGVSFVSRSVWGLGQTIVSALLFPFQAIWGVVQKVFGFLSSPLAQVPFVGQFFKRAESSPVQRFATGGLVGGSGAGDRVPAMLTPGEFVINAADTRRNYGFLQAINQGMPAESALELMPVAPPPIVMPPNFPVGAARDPLEALENASIHIDIHIANINISGNSGSEVAREFVDELSPRLKQAIKELLREQVELSRAL